MKKTFLIAITLLLCCGCSARTGNLKPSETVTIEDEIPIVVCDLPEMPEKIYRNIPLEEDLQDIADDAANENGIKPDVLYAVMQVESGFHTDAENGSCKGLMQVNEINADYLKEEIGITNLKDPAQNIRAGAFLLGKYLKEHSLAESLMMYNNGPSGAKKLWNQGIYSTHYTEKVFAVLDQYYLER